MEEALPLRSKIIKVGQQLAHPEYDWKWDLHENNFERAMASAISGAVETNMALLVRIRSLRSSMVVLTSFWKSVSWSVCAIYSEDDICWE